ncbi:IS110 family transposase [Marinomonas mediterranea]|uniref:Transposase IS116/IS110/IS902 family protein n=1 Tax=Marinomonas mediterranea (strain ATCC 700492 / JCM 21426 / NBRC 103028 / MMB-1) TaxID=717774 RepID=F2JWV0_MARM1|nr:IS110 family transposase [Marinomonas mediterranea]ADZ92967.1 transposase IS116/IS110/IS902 family protein [Marinomonas mediterranea MMB-1]WCN14942.1 IS110 family transposase [Marinomonas mediterranea]WCN18986.1 IS110 family transposase [Marinomonas mediterranea MMB-1]
MIYIGIDVGKNKLDCLWLKDVLSEKIKTKVFKNNPEDFERIAQWLTKVTTAQPEQLHVTLEATGVYHEGIATHLFQLGFQVSVVNPARSKEFAKALGVTHKTDKSDRLLLAKFGYQVTPKLWTPEAPEVRKLKVLIKRIESIEKDIQRELNRKEQAEIAANSYIVIVSVLVKEKNRLIEELDTHIDNHPTLKVNRRFLESIPGVGSVVSAYLGLIPRIRESGTLKGRSMLSKVGPANVRAKIYMAAVVAKQHNPDVKALYERLKSRGKTHMQALGAAMRKLVQICFGVVKHQSEYKPQIV